MQELWQSLVGFVNLWVEPLGYEFMVRALISAVLVGSLCAVMGSYLVVRRLSLLGLVVSNSVVPGIAVAFLLYVNIFVGGFISGILATVGLGWLQGKTRIKEDAAMGVVLSTFFGLGILLITKIQAERKVNLNNFLFGNILGINASDLITSAGIAAVVLLAVWALYKEFLLLSFDAQWAAAAGLPTRALHYAMMALTALTVVASMQAVGVALTIALMVIPAATASLLTNRLATMMGLSVGLGVTSSVVGLYLSYYLNLSSGPTITLVSALLFAAVVLAGPLLLKVPTGSFLGRLKGMVVLEGASGAVPPSEPATPAPQPAAPAGKPAMRIVRDSDGRLSLQPDQPSGVER